MQDLPEIAACLIRLRVSAFICSALAWRVSRLPDHHMQFKTITPSDQEWHRTKLSLERPYKDDEGNLIPNLLDIAPDGQFIYEPREEPDAKIGEQFRRIFIERGINFFDLDPAFRYKEGHADEAGDEDGEVEARDDTEKRDEESHPMSPEELRKMREEIVPRLQ